MTKTSTFLLLSLLTLFFISSCSIEKRTFNRGYHVTWNHSLKKQKEPQDSDVSEYQITENETEREPIADEVSEDSNLHTTDLSPYIDSSTIIEEPQHDFSHAKDTVYVQYFHEPVGVTSFSAFAAGMGIYLAQYFVYVSGLGFFAFPLIVAGLILGIISMVRFKRNPSMYKSNVFGKIGFYASLVAMILTVIAIIIIIGILLM